MFLGSGLRKEPKNDRPMRDEDVLEVRFGRWIFKYSGVRFFSVPSSNALEMSIIV